MNGVEVIILIIGIFGILFGGYRTVQRVYPRITARRDKKVGLLNEQKLKQERFHLCASGCGFLCDVDQGDVFDGSRWWRKECYLKLLGD